MSAVVVSFISGTLRTLCINAAQKVHQRISRLRSVRYALLDEPDIELPAIKTALDDIVTIFGRQGELTERLSGFLTELSQSGLVTQMALGSVTRVALPGLRAAFAALYLNHFRGADIESTALRSKAGQADAPSDRLYDNLMKMLRASILTQNNYGVGILIGNEILATLNKIVTAEDDWLQRRFIPTNESGKKLTDAEFAIRTPWYFMPPGEVRHVVKELARAIKPTFELIRVEGRAGRGADFRYTEIFVTPRLRHIRLQPLADDSDSVVESELGRPTVGDLLSGLDSAIILGDPGGGKTSLDV